MDLNELLLLLFGGGTIIAVIGSIVLSILCTVVPLAAVGWFLYSRWKKGSDLRLASQNWVPTTGTVIKSRVEVSGGDTTTVSPRVVYEYRVGAVDYQNDQIRAGDRHWAARTSQEAYDTIDRYPVGKEVTVYYDPRNHGQSALER